ncbi:G-protein coupled receptor family C group 5 member D [Triplophysa tibetana]|uniref:G-protein coupled receptor family C group 5 member D n=1 Tax=Triplophysa tibetana TaxID=1572043 RepID=A0A5A9N9H1_9TELE|nr:G-protein coupled receptor family C group 5 member D [Triplophysa tibetana]
MDGGVQRSNGSRPAGCGSGLQEIYWHLCDTWGIAVQATTALGLVMCAGLMLGVLVRWARVSRERGRGAALLLFLLATAVLFALPFSFVISPSAETCLTRALVFGVAFSVVFGALVARGLALLGVKLGRGWWEFAVILALALVQVIIAGEWLLVVLVRDKRPCEFSQAEFAMLQLYVMVLMVGALVLAVRFLCHMYITYSYSHTGQTRRRAKLQAALLILTLLLSVCVWVTWMALLTYGKIVMGRRPDWDDPVISIALVTNGWVLLLGHGVSQVRFICQQEAYTEDPPLDLTGWTRSPEDPAADPQPCRDNGGFQRDTAGRGDQALESSGIPEQEISAEKDYSIPRPTTTNINQPYDEYYEHTV